MDWSSIGFAFTAGLISFFSPCAFPMLPAYISYYLGIEEKIKSDNKDLLIVKTIKHGLLGGMVCALGAISILTTLGIFFSLLGSGFSGVLHDHILLMELVVGVILISMGILMLSGVKTELSFKLKAPKSKGYLGLFAFGALYSLASAGCMAPIFIGIILRAFFIAGFIGSMIVFLSYAVGLALLIIIITLFITSAKEVMVLKMKRVLPYAQKLGSLVLILVGIWLVYYYLTTPSI